MIRLARTGARKQAQYRVVVIEKERARNGRSLEVVGTYNPRRAAVQSGRSILFEAGPGVQLKAYSGGTAPALCSLRKCDERTERGPEDSSRARHEGAGGCSGPGVGEPDRRRWRNRA